MEYIHSFPRLYLRRAAFLFNLLYNELSNLFIRQERMLYMYSVASFFAGIGNSQLGRHDVCSGVGEGILSECQSYYQSEQTACYRRTAATGGKVANLANVKE